MNALVSKTSMGASPSRVRIPPCPPSSLAFATLRENDPANPRVPRRSYSKALKFKNEQEIFAGDFFILNGVMVYVAEVGETHIGPYLIEMHNSIVLSANKVIEIKRVA